MVKEKDFRGLAAKPDRRTILQGLSAVAIAGFPRRAPALITPEKSRPRLDQGVASGDVSTLGAMIWSRTDRAARMHVHWSTHQDFRDLHRIVKIWEYILRVCCERNFIMNTADVILTEMYLYGCY